MRKFRKLPVEIEAIQFTGENIEEIEDWATNDGVRWVGSVDMEWIEIDTLEGTMVADVDDWIIKGVAGEFYPCKPDIFEATYEPVLEVNP